MDENLEELFRNQGRAAAQSLSDLATVSYQEGFVGAVPDAMASASYEVRNGGPAPQTGKTMRFVLKAVTAVTAVAILAAVYRHQMAGEPLAQASRQAELSRVEASAARVLDAVEVVVTSTKNPDGTITPPTVGNGRIAIDPDFKLKVGTKLIATDGSLLGYLVSEDGTYGPTSPLASPPKEGRPTAPKPTQESQPATTLVKN